MKSTWTTIAYRSPKTNNHWIVPGKSADASRSIIDGYFFEEKAGLIWLCHNRIGHRESNYFELVFKPRGYVPQKKNKRPTPGFTGEEQSQGGRDQPLAPGKEALGRLH